jgi:hypothetical protein
MLEVLTRRLQELRHEGAEAIARLPTEDLLQAWRLAVEELADPASVLRRELQTHLRGAHRLSPEGLQAALACVARGAGETVARRLFDLPDAPAGGLDAIVLAGNIPGLFTQPLLRSLAARRAVLVKPASSGTQLATRFVERLRQHLPALEAATVVWPWRGGEGAIEDAAFAAADRVIAYGGEPAMRALAARAGGKLIAHGPKTSLALALPGAGPELWAPRLARDVALFDQRGCLSVAALYVHERPGEWAIALAGALRALATEWPPGPAGLPELSAVRLARDEALLRGLEVHAAQQIASGAVLVEKELGFAPSPGLRTVRIYEYRDLEEIARHLTVWRGRLQGLAICGEFERDAIARFESHLGVSRVAAAGELQEAPATWDDGAAWPAAPRLVLQRP